MHLYTVRLSALYKRVLHVYYMLRVSYTTKYRDDVSMYVCPCVTNTPLPGTPHGQPTECLVPGLTGKIFFLVCCHGNVVFEWHVHQVLIVVGRFHSLIAVTVSMATSNRTKNSSSVKLWTKQSVGGASELTFCDQCVKWGCVEVILS